MDAQSDIERSILEQTFDETENVEETFQNGNESLDSTLSPIRPPRRPRRTRKQPNGSHQAVKYQKVLFKLIGKKKQNVYYLFYNKEFFQLFK